MADNKVILETPAGKYVPLELLERALTAWNNDCPDEEGSKLTENQLSDLFANEFPELNLKIINHEVKAI